MTDGGFRLSMSVAGEEQLARGFSRIADEFSDYSEPFGQVVDLLKEVERKQFESEGSYGGVGWQPLSPRYAAYKEARYGSKPIMVISGLLKESLTGDNPYYFEKIEPLRLTFGSTVPYGIYHQTGTSKMPQRKLINLNENDKKRVTKTIQKWMVQQIDKKMATFMPTIGAAESHVGKI